MADTEIADEMREAAEAFARSCRESGNTLDFTPESVATVEKLIDEDLTRRAHGYGEGRRSLTSDSRAWRATAS